jgi:nucleoside-diphosphate-sugar epimerase
MKILVTGGSGFIGTVLVADLLAEGHSVLIYDKQRSGKYPDLCIQADIRDRRKLSESMQGIDAVYHLAAEHRDDVRPVSLYHDVNVGGAENLVYGLEKYDIKMVVYTSTAAVYGLGSGARSEESQVLPFNDYGRSKHESEVLLGEWVDKGDSRSLFIVRPTVIFGEGNRGNFYNLLNQIAAGKFVMVGKGKNKKSMGYVCNISQFLVLLLSNTLGSGRHIYNYADKPDLTIEELINTVFAALGKEHKNILRLPYSVGLLGGYIFDFLARITGRSFPISSIRIKKFCADTVMDAEKVKQIGFRAPYSLTDAINKTIKFEFLKNDGFL